MRIRTRLVLSSSGVALASLAVAATFLSPSLARQAERRHEDALVAQARLAAEVLGRPLEPAMPTLAAFSRDLAERLGARVTLIGPDGRVVAESTIVSDDLGQLDNLGTRPEVVASRERGLGVARRFSDAAGEDLIYVAVTTRHPTARTLRLARPLSQVRSDLVLVSRGILLAALVALGAAFGVAWLGSAVTSRRVSRIAARGRAYAAGDPVEGPADDGADEIGDLARILETTAGELGARIRALATSRVRMEAMLAGMAEGVLVVDQDGRVEVANDAVRQMLGLTEFPVGRHFLELIRQPDVTQAMAGALAGRSSDTAGISLGRDPERIVVARAAPVAFDSGGGGILVLHDVTELRRTERIRRDFVANVSHELRTPLTAIKGCIEALQDTSLDEAETPRFLDVISRQSKRMERLVLDLLRLARLDAGHERLDLVPCSVQTVFADLVLELTPAADARHQRLLTRISPSRVAVRADPGKLHDLLRNLVENAIGYSPDGTTVVLEAEGSPEAVMLRVIDEGPGIPPAELGRVFERFYRVERSRARDPGGTGLGLAIVRHLVGLHGGRVRAANRPEGGAVFTVELPAANGVADGPAGV